MYARDIQSDTRYALVNVKDPRRVLDRRTFVVYGHAGVNQKWFLHRDGEGWTLRSCYTGEYASVEGYSPEKKSYRNGTKVVGGPQASRWHISKENEAELSRNPEVPAKFRFSLLGANKSIRLPNVDEHVDIEIWDNSEGEGQLWYLDHLPFARDLQSGQCYKLTNAKRVHRSLDLSGADNRKVIGYEGHGGDNQKWEFHQDNGGWTLSCVHLGVYLGPEGYHPSKRNYPHGTSIIASQQTFRWHVGIENEAELKNNPHASAKFRLSVPNSRKCLDLTNYEGCNAEIWNHSEGESQLWYLEVVPQSQS